MYFFEETLGNNVSSKIKRNSNLRELLIAAFGSRNYYLAIASYSNSISISSFRAANGWL